MLDTNTDPTPALALPGDIIAVWCVPMRGLPFDEYQFTIEGRSLRHRDERGTTYIAFLTTGSGMIRIWMTITLLSDPPGQCYLGLDFNLAPYRHVTNSEGAGAISASGGS